MDPKPDLKTIASWYDETYYQHHGGDNPYERSELWLRFFHAIADQIVRSLGPRRVLDAGCAKGFLVEALWERGVETYGIDISEYAIGEVRKDVQPYCRQASLTEPIGGRFDLITCIEVLEHIPDEEARAAVRNLTGATDTILFSSTPTNLTGPTHVNVQPTISWLHQFAEHGFAPDLLFDASFIAPHAFLLRRVHEPPPEDVLVLFSEMIRYRLALADLHRQIEHLNNEVTRLQSAKTTAEAEVATLNHEAHMLRVERHQQEQELAAWAAKNARLTQQLRDKESACEDRLRELEAVRQRELYSTMATLKEYADSLHTTTERLALRLGAAETRLADVSRQTTQMQQSRIWRTLCAAGAIVLSPWTAVRSLGGSGSGKTRQALIPPPPEVPIRIDHESGYASEYARWIAEFETRNESLMQLKLRTLAAKPLISILLPVYRTPVDTLRRTIESVVRQSYSNWQLSIAAADGSESRALERLLSEYTGTDERIQVKYLPANGDISHASNAALAMAAGEFVALLDHDDELAQDALYYAVEAINLRPDVDLLYSDEDKIDSDGERYHPFFKPDWSADLLLSENYVCHFLVARRSLVNQVGGFRSDFDGSQDYDLVLRLTGNSSRIMHIPRVLYHWRSVPASTASSSSEKPYAVDAAQRAIQEEMDRRSGCAAKVVPGCVPGRWRVRYALDEQPQVSIIIPSGGKVEVLRKNLDSLFARTEYSNWEVVVIDNSRQMEIQKLLQKWPDPRRPLRYIDWRNKPFNYSVINNEAAHHCQSPLLLFLNDDTTVIAPGWLDAMVELAARPEIGAVGAKLLYPDGRIQHAGVVMGLFDNCGHAFKGLAGDQQHYFDLPDVIRNVSAVTGACLMVRAAVFQEVGGFDEQTFAVAFNDIDLCLKIGRNGYRVLYTPHALLYHHEAFSKTPEDLIPHPKEVQAMQAKWKDVIAADPFYNPNLTRTAEDYSLRRKA
ncbi:MAG: glycosyltransferase [Acidobacteriia bacterium]|nr:glycosyltransferase [Terriglobia bacterium]